MNVFCALITMIGRSGRALRMRGIKSKAFSSGITTSVMTRSPSPWLIQRQSVAALPVESHFVTRARQSLIEDGADRGIVVGN